MPINELRSIATFVKTAELGSLRRAAIAQAISPQAASQALAQLEKHLGVRLFHRTTRNMALTDEGRQFLESVAPALAGLHGAMQVARRGTEAIAGPIRIVGPRSAFLPMLWPMLDAFLARHPDVRPDIELDDRIGNWVEDRVDVGFRIGGSAEPGVIARRLFPLQSIVCAAPSYLARHGFPDRVDQLAAHRCNAFRNPSTGKLSPWRLQVDGDIVGIDVPAAIGTNTEEIEIESTLAGQALGLLTGVVAAHHIRAGRLVPVLTRHVAAHVAMFLYYGSRVAQPARVRAFIEHAVDGLTDSPAYVLSAKELAAAEAKGRKTIRRT